MAVTAKMVASEILVCGVKAGIKSIPIVGQMAVHVVEGLQKRHDAMGNSVRMAKFEAQISRVERNMRDKVEKEIRTILANLGRPAVPGSELTREMTELRQIFEQGWVPNLFEGILRNSSNLQELRRNPTTFGRMLRSDEKVDPANGMMHQSGDQGVHAKCRRFAGSAFVFCFRSCGYPPDGNERTIKVMLQDQRATRARS
jgi:hypothetical protein